MNIRMIQHFLYCPHRWGLMEIDDAWAENYFVVRGNLIHERVHDADASYTARGKKNFTAVSVWNDDSEYDLFGVVDCIEATPDKSSPVVLPDGKHYRLCIVEYKPTQPKEIPFHEEDALQVFAQKICVDSVFGGDCQAILYYSNVKKRIPLPFDTQFSFYDKKLKDTLTSMRDFLNAGKIPPITVKQNCNGCSMCDICLPKSYKPWNSVQRMERFIKESEGL